MNRLTARFQSLGYGDAAERARRGVLIPYVTAGYPDIATTIELLKSVSPDVVGCVELGIPFSDPIADGPVIQTSFSRALESGFRLADLFDALAAARERIAVPLMAMVSYSIVFRRDPAEFVDRARAAGLDGMLVPDLAFEEARGLAAVGRAADFPLVMMIAPTTTVHRRGPIAELSQPWIYYQSLAGTTGERSALPADLADHVAALRTATGKPICVGFGISTPDQVREVCEVADGAIVGSAIVRRMNAAVERGERGTVIATEVIGFIDELGAAIA